MNDHLNSCATYTPFTSSDQILRFPPDLTFKVYYLEAPLAILGETIGEAALDGLIKINGFHTGVGFQSQDKSRPFEFTLDLVIEEGFSFNSILPVIVTDSDGTKDLVWNNAPQNTIGNIIDKTYWEHSTYICTITSAQVTQVMQWVLDEWQPQNPIYSLLCAVNSLQRDYIFNPIFRPALCDTFCYSILFYLQGQSGGQQTDPTDGSNGLGICVEYTTVPNVSIFGFLSSGTGSITPVNFETNRDEIITFYERLETDISAATSSGRTIGDVLAELEAGTGSIQELIRELEKLLIEFLIAVSALYLTYPVAYYYGYLPNGQPGYWKIINPRLFLEYTNSNLKRSYKATAISGCGDGQDYDDGFSLDLPDCIDNSCFNQKVESTTKSNTFMFIIIFVIIFIIIILLILAAIYNSKNK